MLSEFAHGSARNIERYGHLAYGAGRLARAAYNYISPNTYDNSDRPSKKRKLSSSQSHKPSQTRYRVGESVGGVNTMRRRGGRSIGRGSRVARRGIRARPRKGARRHGRRIRVRSSKRPRRRRPASFQRRVIKTNVARRVYSHTVGNEDQVLAVVANPRPCLLFQPHEGGTIGADTAQNNIIRATTQPFYPYDYATLEFMVHNYNLSVGETWAAEMSMRQKYLIDCRAKWTFSSMSREDCVVGVYKWYCPRGVPSAILDPAATVPVGNYFSILNLFGAAATEQTGVGPADATNNQLYGAETIDQYIHSSYIRRLGIKIKKQLVTVRPGGTIVNHMRCKERLLTSGTFWNQASQPATGGSTVLNPSAVIGRPRIWYIGPGSRGYFYCVYGHNAGITLTANVASVSHRSNSTLTFTTPAFAHTYEVVYGVRHIPQQVLSTVFMQDAGTTTAIDAVGAVVSEETDEIITAVDNAI